jgi:DamX protein
MNTSPNRPDPQATERDVWIGDRAPDPALFFNGPAHARLLELLRHLTENTADVALVVGPPGSGKTTLLFQFQGLAPAHWALCRVDANPMLHPDQLLNRLARHIGEPHSDDPVPDALASAFAALRLQGRLPVVVVDDAEQLPISSLLLLLRLHEKRAESLPVCALILLADPAIDAILSSHQLHAMGTARFQRLEMPQLTEDQVPDYVRHFLILEGVRAELNLSPAHLARIHSDSAGVPGRINELVIRALREPAARRGKRIPAALAPLLNRLRVTVQSPSSNPLPRNGRGLGRGVKKGGGTERLRLRRLSPMQIASLISLVLALLLGLLFQDRINRLFESPSPESGPPGSPQDASRPGEEQTVQALPLPPQREEAPESASAKPLEPLSEPLIPPLEAMEVTPRPPPEAPVGADAEPTPAQPAPSRQTEPAPPPASTPVAERENAPEAPTAPAKSTVSVQSSAPAPSPPPSPPKRTAPLPAPVTDLTPRIADKAWLLRRPPEQWTVQILAAGSESALRRFVARHKPQGQLAFFETRRDGVPWFSLLQGVYPDHASATAARDAMPRALRRTGAWPRSFSSVQQEIRRSGR